MITLIASTDSEKAEIVENVFASVSNRESKLVEATIQPRPCQFSFRVDDIIEQIILQKLNNPNFKLEEVSIYSQVNNTHGDVILFIKHDVAYS